ncbi:MAG TPA: PAS domain-containing sensor histidine kinase, partial [Lysobacter sp.]
MSTNAFVASSDADAFWGGPVASQADFLALVHPEDREKMAGMLRSAAQGEVPYELEYRLVGADGRVRWLQTRRRIELAPDGTPRRIRGISADITSLKRAEIATRLLADAGRTLGASLDYETTLASLSRVLVPQLADWYAVDLLDAHGELERIAVHHPDPAKVEMGRRLHAEYPPSKDAPIGTWHTIRTGTPSWAPHLTDEMFVQGARDAEHLALMRALGLNSFVCVPMAARGAVIGVITLVYAESGRRYTQPDVDLAMQIAERAAVAVDNARLFRALQDADRRKDEFLAMLAHELRNPLAPINMAAELLRVVASDLPPVQRAAGIITRQVGHMTELVDDLLDVSRVTRGLVELQREPVDVRLVVAAAIEQVQALIASREHTLHTHVAPGAMGVLGDRARLIQIVVNLLNNAAKYTRPGGEVELRVEPLGERVRIQVRDNGTGIEPALLPRVFDLFAQGERTPDRSQGGLGIGLALVRSLVGLHGGEVRAESAGTDRGSVFTVLLPR